MWLTALLLTPPAARAAPDERVVREEHVEVSPADVYAVVSDARRWEAWWHDAPPNGKEARWNSRGEPATPGQELRWTAGVGGAGALELTAVDPGREVEYRFQWLHRPAKPPDDRTPVPHVGRVVIEPDGDGARIRWEATAARLPFDGLSGRRHRLEATVTRRMDLLIAHLPTATDATPHLADPPPQRVGSVYVWQGYHHRWTYNHRINRHGNWIGPEVCADDACATPTVHSAASGSGIDRFRYDQRATFVDAPGVESWAGRATLWFDGAEGERMRDEVCVPAPAPGGEVVLQGWDLDAVGAADSLWEVAAGVREEAGNVCVDGLLRMACYTPECGTERRTAYTVAVYWMQLAGPVVATPATVTVDERWEAGDIRDEVVPAQWQQAITLTGAPALPAATVGFRRLAIELLRPHHTLGLDLAVLPGAYDPAAGTLAARVDLLFVPWGPVEIAPLTVAQFAQAGSAKLAADVVLLQLPGGCVATVVTEGEGVWPGKGEDGSGPTAEVARELTAPGCPKGP